MPSTNDKYDGKMAAFGSVLNVEKLATAVEIAWNASSVQMTLPPHTWEGAGTVLSLNDVTIPN